MDQSHRLPTLLALGLSAALLPAPSALGSPSGGVVSAATGLDPAESAREARLKAATSEELRRQEALLRQLDARATRSGPPDVSLDRPADPRAAPRVPGDRDLPLDIFDERQVRAPAGAEPNARKILVVERSLDADRDGKPEQVRHYHPESGRLLHKREDRDYDGAIDAWSTYQDGVLMERALDHSGDGRRDVWERYVGGRMVEREVDRNEDGRVDAHYRYRGDSLVEERHDTNHDGEIDLVVEYRDRRRVRAEEDRDRDGRVDSWTTFRAEGDAELVARIERDEKGRGRPDTFETFEARDGRAVLVQREEDLNGDGEIDVRSIYRDGKLIRREILDPSQVPL